MACGANQTAQVYIGGVEQTSVAIAGSWTPRLNRPAQAQVTTDMETDAGDCGDPLMITLDDDEIVFHGPILNTETDTSKDGGRTVYNAQDHMELWNARVVRADDCDFSKPFGDGTAGGDLFSDYVYAPDIMAAVLTNTVDCGGGPPTDSEGDIFLDLGAGFGVGVTDVSGAPVDVPMTIMELFSLLVSTGTLDGIITYTNPGGGVTGTIDFYNGDYGSDQSGSVDLDYGQGQYSVANLRWNRDMTNMVNKYWLYGGPRVQTAADPQGDQHWCFNVTGTDAGLAGYPGSNPYAAVIARRGAAQAAYGVRMKVDILDQYDADCIPGFGTPGRELARYQWLVYSYFAATPREIIHVQPVDDRYIGCFGIGDLVGVSAASQVKGGFSGKQRVYGYTVSWDATPSVLTLSEIQTSADAEGMA